MYCLERNSPADRRRVASFRALSSGRVRHNRDERLCRHRHDTAFAAVVLSGSYAEAGDSGHHRVAAGDVIIHRAYESHLNCFGPTGCDVIILPLDFHWGTFVVGRILDPDHVARVAEQSLPDACRYLAKHIASRQMPLEDWPDVLANALRENPDLAIADWARLHGLHPGSISRGFERRYGTTPAAFRATMRAHDAIRMIMASNMQLADIAAATRFSDQAHMCRVVRATTGQSPAALRASRRGAGDFWHPVHR